MAQVWLAVCGVKRSRSARIPNKQVGCARIRGSRAHCRTHVFLHYSKTCIVLFFDLTHDGDADPVPRTPDVEPGGSTQQLKQHRGHRGRVAADTPLKLHFTCTPAPARRLQCTGHSLHRCPLSKVYGFY